MIAGRRFRNWGGRPARLEAARRRDTMESMGEKAGGMIVTSAIANVVGHDDTAKNLINAVTSGLGGRRADLLLVFSSAHFDDEVERLVERVNEALSPRTLIGTSGEAVICNALEYEHQPALSIWAAHLPDVELRSFHFSDHEDLSRIDGDEALREHLGVPADVNSHFILLGDPFSFGRGTLDLLERLNSAFPGRPAIGGMASAADSPNENIVVFDGEVLRHGLTGVALWGRVTIDTIVSQGCRPIGRHLVITRSEKNAILEVGGITPYEAIQKIWNESPARDRELVMRGGLLVGRVINEYKATFSRGDFLVQNPMHIDKESGAMFLPDRVRPGQTIQFHLRDGDSAADDLKTLLSHPRPPAAGGLLFSCNGRGTRLFPDRNHDARAVTESAGAIPVAGFFCAGEIGPIGARNFVHGHTASIGFFRPA